MCSVVSHTPTVQDAILNVRIQMDLQIKGWESYTMQALIKKKKVTVKVLEVYFRVRAVSSDRNLTVTEVSVPRKLHSPMHRHFPDTLKT